MKTKEEIDAEIAETELAIANHERWTLGLKIKAVNLRQERGRLESFLTKDRPGSRGGRRAAKKS